MLSRSESLAALNPLESLQAELDELRRRDLWRECLPFDQATGATLSHAGRAYLNFSSNDYLDLARHPAVVEAAREAAAQWGAGTGAARLITGTRPLAEELEGEIAALKRAEAALLFSSGYMANLGAVTALARRGDWVICDALNHASLIDAARLSGATIRVYAHNDAEAAGRALAEAPPEARKLILTDGVFSMDGDIAPLAELSALAEEHGAFLVVDDAHGTGVLGPEGRGSCAAAGVSGPHIVHVVTLSKALGSQGGAVAGARTVIDYLVNRSRPFIFETALAPACMGAALAALRIAREDGARREALARNAAAFRSALGERGIEVADCPTPIIPIHAGTNARALALSAALRARGIWVTAIRPPSVEEGKARLRATVTSAHSVEEVRRFASALGDVNRELRIKSGE